MEEEIQKRNTDCVYFLASPLTCKKGLECEFRHSDIARLNPKDCWYWLAGNCLNPACPFRHPPLEGRAENSSEPTSVTHRPSVPLTKSTVPCYFYFNGFCNKGDNCSFLHGPHSATSGNFSKAASTVANAHPVENKAPVSNEETPTATEPPSGHLKTTAKAREVVHLQSKVEYQASASNNFLQQSPSPRNSLHECDEAIVKSEILCPAETPCYSQGVDRSPLCADQSQSSEDQFDNHMEPDERWESSPGFDVLVDDGSEKLGYDDDPEYLLKMEDGVLHEHLLQYDYEDQVGYDPLDYPESGNLYELGMYGSYDHPEDEHISDHIRGVPKRPREMLSNPVVFQKRRRLSREDKFNDRNGDADLRSHLQKRRRIPTRLKRTSLSHPNGRGQEFAGRWHSREPIEGRLASEVGTDMIGRSEYDSHRRGWPRQSLPRYNRSRQQDRERRRQARPQFDFLENSRGNRASRDGEPTPESSITFTGPKTLAQIKEEKRKSRENSKSFRSTSRNGRATSQNFEGPKPLGEILKDKRRLDSVSDDNTSSRSRHDHSESEMKNIGSGTDNDERLYEYEDDDDYFGKKLSSIAS